MVDETTVVQKRRYLIDEEGELRPSLIIIHGKEIGKKYDLHKSEMKIGRADGNEIQINEEDVSRLHATLTVGPDEVRIRDEKSTNGTFVNTKRVQDVGLSDGDLILLGNTILKFISSSSVESQYHESIYRLATLDGLTQVFNKAHMLEKAEGEFGRSRRYGRELSLVLFDFDHFKKVNDTYGHPAGDFILQKTASIVMKNLRKEDIFGRYGGEEFMLILPETAVENAHTIADKLRVLIQSVDYEYQGQKLAITISAGVAALNAAIHSFAELLQRTDKALYRAKQEGRNRVVKA
jgi:diguanylate cyclase (GGDEF)-like protein